MGQGSKNKTVFKLPVEIIVVIGRVSIMYFLLHSTVRYWCIVFIDMGKILSTRKHVTIQLLRATAQLLVSSISLIYLVDEFYFLFVQFLLCRWLSK